jgi:hypothetical protein
VVASGVRTRALVVVFVSSCLLPSTVKAQSQGDWSGLSYSFLHAMNSEDTNLPAGWLLSLDIPVPSSRRGDVAFKPVLEFGGNYWRQNGESIKVHTVQYGARFAPGGGRFRPFGQFLVGGAFVNCCNSSGTHVSIEPGVGVDFDRRRPAPSASVPTTRMRVAVGFPMMFGGSANLKMIRVQVGYRFRFYADTL